MTKPIYIASTANHSNSPRILHTRTDCETLTRATKILEKDPAVYPPNHREWCKVCTPKVVGDD